MDRAVSDEVGPKPGHFGYNNPFRSRSSVRGHSFSLALILFRLYRRWLEPDHAEVSRYQTVVVVLRGWRNSSNAPDLSSDSCAPGCSPRVSTSSGLRA